MQYINLGSQDGNPASVNCTRYTRMFTTNNSALHQVRCPCSQSTQPPIASVDRFENSFKKNPVLFVLPYFPPP